MLIQIEVHCKTCYYLDHSGAFTPGGAQDICGYSNAPASFYPDRSVDYYALSREYCHKLNSCKSEEEREALGDGPSHWKYRKVDVQAPNPPLQCPLRVYEVKTCLDWRIK